MAINVKQLELESGAATAKRTVPAVAANEPLGAVTRNSAHNLFKRVVSADERMFFTEQLALLLDTGNSLLESLRSISRHAGTQALKELVTTLADDVEQGQSFSYALAKHPQVFSTTYCNLIKASEQGGFMADVLEELKAMDEKRNELRATMQSALSYPAFLLAFSFAVVVFVLAVVFPKFAEMFGAMADQLPASTKVLMALSQSLISHWPWYLLGLGALISGAVLAFRSARLRYALDTFKLRAPVVKTVFAELYLVQSMRVMALSLSRGVSLVDTLAACRDVVANQCYKDFFRKIENDLQEGRGLSQGFRSAEFVPDMVKQMVTTGEASGSLPKVMARIADHYERQLEKRLQTLSKAAEPLMLVIMGAVVGILVSSLILPIFKMSAVAT